MELDCLFRLAIPFLYITFEIFFLRLMCSYSVYVLFFIADAWFRTMSLFMDIDLFYYCTHFGCGLCFTLSIYVYLVACRVNIFIMLTFLHTLLINFIPLEIRCAMCASRSPEE